MFLCPRMCPKPTGGRSFSTQRQPSYDVDCLNEPREFRRVFDRRCALKIPLVYHRTEADRSNAVLGRSIDSFAQPRPRSHPHLDYVRRYEPQQPGTDSRPGLRAHRPERRARESTVGVRRGVSRPIRRPDLYQRPDAARSGPGSRRFASRPDRAHQRAGINRADDPAVS